MNYGEIQTLTPIEVFKKLGLHQLSCVSVSPPLMEYLLVYIQDPIETLSRIFFGS